MRHGILLFHMKCTPTNRSFLSQPPSRVDLAHASPEGLQCLADACDPATLSRAVRMCTTRHTAMQENWIRPTPSWGSPRMHKAYWT